MMRVNSANQFERSIETLQLRQQSLAATQEQIASGKRVLRPSDDPAAAARAERALAQQYRVDADRRGLEASRGAMVQAESALGDAVGLMQRVRDLVVQAGSPIYGASQRSALVEELKVLRQQVIDIANRGDGMGGFLFAGQGAGAAPFVDGAQGVAFRGTPGEMGSAGANLPLSVDGRATWMNTMSGNGVFVTTPGQGNGDGAWIDAGRVTDATALTGTAYSIEFVDDGNGGTAWQVAPPPASGAPGAGAFVSGQAIEFDGLAVRVHGKPVAGDRFEITPSERDLTLFDALDRTIAGLSATGRSGAQFTQTVQTSLRDLDATIGTLVTVRTRLGGVLEQADGLDSRLAGERLAAQTARSSAEDVDLAQAVSEFQAKQTSYDAALKAYSMVQRLSLFDYMR
jgi:flagellar hook-associated protein 3 FlgL